MSEITAYCYGSQFVITRGIIYVTLQMCCLGLLLISGPLIPGNPWLALLAIGGVLLGVWAILAMRPGNVSVLPELRPTARLVLRGPYRFVRHPMYSALLIFSGALLIDAFSPLRLLLWLILLTVLVRKLSYEERLLVERFPNYAAYQQRSARLLPYIY
jgi:protein-S-isoprenylcysteine O-methyltransferase Ste14